MPDLLKPIMNMSCFIPAALVLFFWKKIPVKFHLLCVMMIIDTITEVITYSINSEVIFNIYNFINLSLFLFFVHTNSKISDKAFKSCMIMAIVLSIYALFTKAIGAQPDYYVITITYAMILFISINILAFQVFETNTSLTENFWFWLSVAFVIYNGYGTLVFGLKILRKTDTVNTLGNLWSFVNLIYYSLITLSLTKVLNQKQWFTPKIVHKTY